MRPGCTAVSSSNSHVRQRRRARAHLKLTRGETVISPVVDGPRSRSARSRIQRIEGVWRGVNGMTNRAAAGPRGRAARDAARDASRLRRSLPLVALVLVCLKAAGVSSFGPPAAATGPEPTGAYGGCISGRALARLCASGRARTQPNAHTPPYMPSLPPLSGPGASFAAAILRFAPMACNTTRLAYPSRRRGPHMMPTTPPSTSIHR